MPNWCSNRTEITGPADDIAAFRKNVTASRDVDNHYSLLGTFIPRPDSVVEDGTWYDWSLEHWGCKWEDDVRLVQDDPDRLMFVGDTPWSPPLAGYATIAAKWPTLTIVLSYCEEGMGFAGAASYAEGVLQSDAETDKMPDFDEDDSDAYDDEVQALIERLTEVVRLAVR